MSECWASSGHGLRGPGYQLQVEGLSCNYVVSAAAFVIGHVSRAVLAASWFLSGTWSASLTVPVTNGHFTILTKSDAATLPWARIPYIVTVSFPTAG